jgi:hypothetical protein
MSNDEFQARIARVNSKTQHPPSPTKQPNGLGRFSWAGAFRGFALSLVIGFAFANLQTISDMAPQSIKDGPTPGIFGAPVAVISILWIIITPIWFFRTVMKGAMSSWSTSPAGFPLGLFAGLAVSLLALRGGF